MSKKKYNTRLFKNIISGLLIIFLFFWLFQIDWNNVSSKNNSGAFFGVFVSIMIVISLQIKNKIPKE